MPQSFTFDNGHPRVHAWNLSHTVCSWNKARPDQFVGEKHRSMIGGFPTATSRFYNFYLNRYRTSTKSIRTGVSCISRLPVNCIDYGHDRVLGQFNRDCGRLFARRIKTSYCMNSNPHRYLTYRADTHPVRKPKHKLTPIMMDGAHHQRRHTCPIFRHRQTPTCTLSHARSTSLALINVN